MFCSICARIGSARADKVIELCGAARGAHLHLEPERIVNKGIRNGLSGANLA